MPQRRRFFAEIAALVAASALCATIANAVAAKERKLAWVCDYPNALTVPPRRTEPAAQIPPPDSAILSETGGGQELPAASLVAENDTVATTTIATGTSIPPEKSGGASPAKAPASAKAPVPPPAAAARQWTLADFPARPDVPAVDITTEQAKALFDLRVPFIDARRSNVYEAGHIAGAISMPVWESDIDDRVARFYEAGRPGDAPLVIYCSGGNCEDSHMLAQKLWGIGYDNILVYLGGWPDWQKHGYPAARGPAQ